LFEKLKNPPCLKREKILKNPENPFSYFIIPHQKKFLPKKTLSWGKKREKRENTESLFPKTPTIT